MKRIKRIIPLLLVSLIFSMTITTSATGEGWFIVKRKNECPGFPKSASDLDRHECYYVDKTANKSGEKVIYLTFDAGYENGNVGKILDTLKEKEVRGAFFVLFNIICKNPELIKRMQNEGHAVCNHTRNHKNLTKLTDEEITENIMSLESICEEKTGVKISPYFRFPEGFYSLKSVEAVEKLGYKTVFWSIAYADWDNGKQPAEEEAKKSLLDQTHPGAIVLLHPTSSTNAQILGEMIDTWRDMGYRFGTLDELVSKNQNLSEIRCPCN